jgi:Uma2 family endonuclease
MVYLREALKEHFRVVPDVYVAGNLLLYYVEGQPRFCVAPDAFVVRGVPKGRRKVYKLWQEGKGPCLAVEVTSDSTRDEDLETKKDVYERLGVEEYILFDPQGDYLDPTLQAHRLVAGRYQPLLPERDGSILSRTTGILFRPMGERLQLVDAASGTVYLRDEEEREENRKLKKELERLRRELERR